MLHELIRREEEEATCQPSDAGVTGIKIGSIFIILFSSLFTTLFPIVCARVDRIKVPNFIFDFAKYFGSGVILATGFIHLLEPATDELGSPCLSAGWGEYPYAFGICLISLYLTFLVEMLAFRIGTAKLVSLGLADKSHPHPHPQHAPEPLSENSGPLSLHGDLETSAKGIDHASDDLSDEHEPMAAQLIGVAILEFGVIFHSLIIGLTLAVNEDEFTTLFIVIIFHQAFEGMGLGARLAALRLPALWGFVPYVAAVAYALVTPVGIAIGLGVRSSLALDAAGGAAATGILDAISAGILIYTATVELMAHEFVFNKQFHTCSWGKITYSLTCFAVGAGLMALLGKWA